MFLKYDPRISNAGYANNFFSPTNNFFCYIWRFISFYIVLYCIVFVLIYKHLVRSHLEYNNSVWAPYRKSDIDKLEKVQKRATKMIQGMGNFKYPERLRKLELLTLAYRRNRGDMIVTRTLLYQPARFYLLLTEASLGQDFQPDLLLNYISCHG